MTDQMIERYLLGELSPDELAELEAQYFGDAELLDRIDAAEDDLIDEYVRRELSPAQRLQFESHFLNDERRERVRTAEALHKVTQKKVPTSALLPLAASLFGAALLAIIWLQIQNRDLHEQIAKLRTEARVHKAIPPETPKPTAPLPVAAIVLAPGLTREGGTIATLAIDPQTHTVRIEARLEKQAPRYNATLQRAGEPPVWTGTGLIAQGQRLVLYFPREQFTAGDYILTITAKDFIADYAFTVKFL